MAANDSVKPKSKVLDSFVLIDRGYIDVVIGYYFKLKHHCFISIYLPGCSYVFRPSRTGWTTSVCRVRHPELLCLRCENGCSAPSSRWLRWRSSRQRRPRSSTPCDSLCGRLVQSGSLDLHALSLAEPSNQQRTLWKFSTFSDTWICTVNLCYCKLLAMDLIIKRVAGLCGTFVSGA